MATTHSIVNAIFGSYDLRSSKQWRDEDLAYREQEIQWLNDEIVRAHEWRTADIERSLRKEKMEHEHLACEARAEQLHTVSEQCALLGGFTVIAMSNLDIPNNIHESIVFLYGFSATLVCVLLLLATIISTMLMVAVTRYAGHSLEVSVKQLDITQLEAVSPFGSWWLKKCEREQMRAYKLMGVGVVLFFFYLSVLSWIQFHRSAYAASTINVLCFIALLVWQFRIASRWRYLLLPPSDPPFSPSRTLASSMLLASPAGSQSLPPLAHRRLSAVMGEGLAPSPVSKLASSFVGMR